ncbi:zinc ribbon domain-containing protein [Kitasatospora sp. NPDC018058]|uniref:zinc ribbon domain-containing protein n=1 Tax=Kitasatospora sp. NPDC018058 TaxID=3364025 RepID=UPI0037C19716
MFLAILTATAVSVGRDTTAADPRSTSRRCPACGHTVKENRPAQDTFHCVSCGHRVHADPVGAVSTLRAGPSRRPTG